MKIGLLTDLTTWTEDKLMMSLRRQFGYSVGIVLIFFAPVLGMIIAPKPERGNDFILQYIVTFWVLELLTWGTFIRAWRELRRRIDRKEKQNGFQQ